MTKFHIVTIEHSGETTNLVVELSGEKLIALHPVDAEASERAQYQLAFNIACALLRVDRPTKVFTQVYNREIKRANFFAEYGPEMSLPDGSKGWIVKATRDVESPASTQFGTPPNRREGAAASPVPAK
jgi:hypothetical protein